MVFLRSIRPSSGLLENGILTHVKARSLPNCQSACISTYITSL